MGSVRASHVVSALQSTAMPSVATFRPGPSLLLACLGMAFTLLSAAGCSPASRSPDAIRQTTAAATAAAVRDSKAVAKGVFEGLRQKGPVNINKASQDDLEALPGIDAAVARRIIAGRPYDSSVELLHRHILTRQQYNQIASKVVAH